MVLVVVPGFCGVRTSYVSVIEGFFLMFPKYARIRNKDLHIKDSHLGSLILIPF